MAIQKHEVLFQRGVGAINEWRRLHPDKTLDLSHAVLQDLDVSGADLSNSNLNGATLLRSRFEGANLSGADLSKTNLAHAKLREANLSKAKLVSSDLTKADLTGAKLDEASFQGANLTEAVLPLSELRKADIRGANFNGCDLKGVELQDCDLENATFNRARLDKANLSKARLFQSSFASAFLLQANLAKASLIYAGMTDAMLVAADLRGASLGRANLGGAHLDNAKIDKADFHEANISDVNFTEVCGAANARRLETTLGAASSKYFETAERALIERLCDWETIRIFGKLPLFAASYTVLISIPIVFYGYAIYNERTDTLREWAGANTGEKHAAGGIAAFVTDNFQRIDLPAWSLELLLSTVLLAVASTIYAVACPSRIKEFSKDQWCDELNKPLVHYWAYSWKFRTLRVATFALYIVGAIGVGTILTIKIWNAGVFIFQNSGWTLF